MRSDIHKVYYSKDKHIAWYKGARYRLSKDGYYHGPFDSRCNTTLLHRIVYFDYHMCSIEKLHVHHKDENRFNNDISNLELLTPHEHSMMHIETHRESARKHMLPAAQKWHKEHAEEYRRYCIEVNYPRTKDLLHVKVEHVCLRCGKHFKARHGAKYCSMKCLRAAYREDLKHYEQVNCEICGKPFMRDLWDHKERGLKRTCSRDCARQLQFKIARERLPRVFCIVCGNEIVQNGRKKLPIHEGGCYSRWMRHKDQYPDPWSMSPVGKSKRQLAAEASNNANGVAE